MFLLCLFTSAVVTVKPYNFKTEVYRQCKINDFPFVMWSVKVLLVDITRSFYVFKFEGQETQNKNFIQERLHYIRFLSL